MCGILQPRDAGCRRKAEIPGKMENGRDMGLCAVRWYSSDDARRAAASGIGVPSRDDVIENSSGCLDAEVRRGVETHAEEGFCLTDRHPQFQMIPLRPPLQLCV